ncbi:CU044_2847 family protein [Nonomuraea sp. 10N515B]|uniref:CU044_2847 family protein n=1 Tax=Nonomuraea sp. 10N515B TaxID=3457422 RepID=UPI003FCD2082
MASQVVPMRFGGVEVLVQTVPVAGTERASRVGDAGQRVLDAFEEARAVIVAAANSTVEVIGRLGNQAARPTVVEVEFGLGFSAKGNVIVASASGDATLKVKLTYDTRDVE